MRLLQRLMLRISYFPFDPPVARSEVPSFALRQRWRTDRYFFYIQRLDIHIVHVARTHITSNATGIQTYTYPKFTKLLKAGNAVLLQDRCADDIQVGQVWYSDETRIEVCKIEICKKDASDIGDAGYTGQLVLNCLGTHHVCQLSMFVGDFIERIDRENLRLAYTKQ
jgi:hypothetical protein